jgi:hypothetical protein
MIMTVAHIRLILTILLVAGMALVALATLAFALRWQKVGLCTLGIYSCTLIHINLGYSLYVGWGILTVAIAGLIADWLRRPLHPTARKNSVQVPVP